SDRPRPQPVRLIKVICPAPQQPPPRPEPTTSDQPAPPAVSATSVPDPPAGAGPISPDLSPQPQAPPEEVLMHPHQASPPARPKVTAIRVRCEGKELT